MNAHTKPLAWLIIAMLLGGCPSATTTPKTNAPNSNAQPGSGSGSPTAATGRLPSAFRRTDPRAHLAPGATRFDLYVMSKCPFGTRVENTLAELVKVLPEHLDLRVDYITTKTASGFSALHGPDELSGNKIELCVMKRYPLPRTFMPFLRCQNRDFRQVPHNWKDCARSSNMDIARIETCLASEADTLLAASLQRAKDAGARGSPTMVIGGRPYSGKRTRRAFLRAICDAVTGRKPRACSELGALVPLRVTVLGDKRCTKCRTGYELRRLRSAFAKVVVRHVDYASSEGKKLYKDLGLKLLPAVILAADAPKTDGYDAFKRWLTAAGGRYTMRVWNAKWDPTAEICDNGKDDTGNGKVDCADATCAKKVICRKLMPRHLTMFMRSRCPYCNRAIKQLAPAIKRMGRKLRFEVHFVARQRDPNGQLRSMYGPADLDEAKRRLCAARLLGRSHARRMRLLRYMTCRADNYREDVWKPCARKSRLPVKRVARCAAGKRGEKLLERDAAIGHKLEINGTPTFLINNRYKVSGGIASKVERELCKRNKTLPGC